MGNKEQKPGSSTPFINRIHELTQRLFELEQRILDELRLQSEKGLESKQKPKEEESDGGSKPC